MADIVVMKVYGDDPGFFTEIIQEEWDVELEEHEACLTEMIKIS